MILVAAEAEEGLVQAALDGGGVAVAGEAGDGPAGGGAQAGDGVLDLPPPLEEALDDARAR
ncbi:MAG: hypothetical protein KDK70_25780 [Myxococcales bacterium]|nr:hypothetical protein [Myxococcales bacterium]